MITILVKNQIVETTWNPTTKDWYVSKGYQFTKFRDKFNIKVEDLHPGSTVKVKVICDYCGEEIEKTYRDYLKQLKIYPKSACKKCNGKKNKDANYSAEWYYNDFTHLCEENGYKMLSDISDYKGSKSYLEIWCPKHGVQSTAYVRARVGRFCPVCGKEHAVKQITKPTEEVIKIIEEKNNNQLLNPEDYINFSTSNLKIKCGKCGKVWTTSLASIKGSDGLCPDCGAEKCHNSLRLSPEEVSSIIASKNGNVLLNPEDYIKNDVRNLKIKCGLCGRIYVTNLTNYTYFHVDRCNVCARRESSGEKIIREILESKNVVFEQEKRFDGCKDKKQLPFDFYLPDNNTCIEFDGPHHYRAIYGDLEHTKMTQYHDQIKNEYCGKNGINLIRIPYWEGHNIEEILTKELHI